MLVTDPSSNAEGEAIGSAPCCRLRFECELSSQASASRPEGCTASCGYMNSVPSAVIFVRVCKEPATPSVLVSR